MRAMVFVGDVPLADSESAPESDDLIMVPWQLLDQHGTVLHQTRIPCVAREGGLFAVDKVIVKIDGLPGGLRLFHHVRWPSPNVFKPKDTGAETTVLTQSVSFTMDGPLVRIYEEA